MGGRGTFALGNLVPYQYETVDCIEGVKILEPVNKRNSFNMPAEAHSSQAYILLDKNGVFRQYREYDAKHRITKEIGFHFESGLSESGKSVFHIHEFSKPGIDNRQNGRLMTPEEISRYRKYFKNVSQEIIEAYLDYYRRITR